MVAALMPERPTVAIAPPLHTERKLLCACCRRYVGTVRVYAGLPPRTVWTRVHCHSCGRWRWFDLATGEMGERPERPET